MEVLVIYPETEEQENLYKQLAKALRNRIEIKPLDKGNYDAGFIEKINQGRKEKSAGDFKAIPIEDVWK